MYYTIIELPFNRWMYIRCLWFTHDLSYYSQLRATSSCGRSTYLYISRTHHPSSQYMWLKRFLRGNDTAFILFCRLFENVSHGQKQKKTLQPNVILMYRICRIILLYFGRRRGDACFLPRTRARGTHRGK